ncbi:zinc knuckle CX2CX4HX4C containing protein [Tanacetum coccineum]
MTLVVDRARVNCDVNSVDRASIDDPREPVVSMKSGKDGESDSVMSELNKPLIDELYESNCKVQEDSSKDDCQMLDKGANSGSKKVKSKNGEFLSYVTTALAKNTEVNWSLFVKPTEVDENGNEYVLFDESITNEGCKRWELTLCGYFVGHQMSISELRYNLKRMWGRRGFKDIVDVFNGVFFMKFFNEEGLESVVNSGPWMVNNKPFFVQKWDIHVCLDKREPSHIPIWVKLCNIPLEAWTTSDISALASRLGKPLVMDTLTVEICKKGVGKVKYARVLVGVPTAKDIPNKIEVVYRGKDSEEMCRKKVIVKFDWVPPRCSNCCVFGHDIQTCGKVNHGKNKALNAEEPSKKKDNGNNGDLNDGFTKVRNKKETGVSKKRQDRTNMRYQKKSEKPRVDATTRNLVNQFVFQKKQVDGKNDIKTTSHSNENESIKSPANGSTRKAWSVQDVSILEALKRSANKYAVLDDHRSDNQPEEIDGSHTELEPGEINDVLKDDNGIAQ